MLKICACVVSVPHFSAYRTLGWNKKMTTPTNLYFFAEFYKKEPAGSKKQVINLVWPKVQLCPHAAPFHCMKGLSFQLVHCLANVRVQASFQDL